MKKAFCVTGIIVSLVTVLFGILTLSGAFGGDTDVSYASYAYDSGYASFGADFYTYINNNAAAAAKATSAISYNLRSISNLIRNICGCGFISLGMLCLCGFCILLKTDKEKNQENAQQNITQQTTIDTNGVITTVTCDNLPEL